MYSLDHADDVPSDVADDAYSNQHGQLGDVDGEDQLLLTQHGEDISRPPRQVRFASGPNSDSDDMSDDDDDASDDETSNPEQEGDQDEDEDMTELDAQELAEEAANLSRDLAEEGNRPETKSRSTSRSATVASEHIKRPNRPNASDLGPLQYGQDAVESPLSQGSLPDLAVFDKVVAVRAAFNVSHRDAVKLLRKHNLDVSKVWRTLERSLKPRQGLAETMVLATQLELPREVQIISSPARSPVETLGDISRIDDDYDEQNESSSSDEEGVSDDSDESSDGEEKHGSGARDSDSDGDSESSSEYVSARPSPPQGDEDDEDDANDDSSSSSEDSSSDSERLSRPAKSSKAQRKQTKTRTKSNNMRQAQEINSSDSSDAIDSSSEEEARVILRTQGPRGRKIVSSDESSSSSSDSSSDSSSESDFEKEDTTPTAQSQSSRDSLPKQKSPARSHQTTPRQNAPVPPGQGLTRTQRRNHRRRLQTQSKKAALQPPAGSRDTRETPAKDDDLEAKKRALLQALGSESKTLDLGSGQAVEDFQMGEAAQDAWRQKILYRAIECVQEGVELSEPPFPFIQRWDPQQRWASQPNPRRGKRKSRADSQFYNQANSRNAKKQKSEQPVEEYSYREDGTICLSNQGDMVLDYDDVTFHPDQGPMANGYTGQTPPLADEQVGDNLPPLPEDISSRPVLHAGEVKVGMVIAFKQLLCTEATQWQPQLSEYMIASVTELGEGSENFQVQLARRDRNLDRNEKKYDEETGQRVYGKFEAPDSDEDEDALEEEDNGIREVFFSEMIEPRIVQQVIRTGGIRDSSGNLVRDETSKSEEPGSADSQLPELGFEVADSQPKHAYHERESSGRRTDSQDHSGTLDNDRGGKQESETTHTMQIHADVAVEESFVPETIHGQPDSLAGDASITEDRRGEISELINEGGFRQGIRSSIAQSAFLQFGQGSPSRQLEEEYASSILLSKPVGISRSNSSSGAPSEYDTKEPTEDEDRLALHLDFRSNQLHRTSPPHSFQGPSQEDGSQAAAGAETDTFHSAPQNPNPQQMRSGRLNEEDSIRLTTPRVQQSAGLVEYPKLSASQTTQASDLSGGRQLDPNFITHSDDLGNSLLGESPAANGFDYDDDTALGGETTELDQPDRERKLKQMCNGGLGNASVSGTPVKSTQLEAQPSSRPQSAVSQESDSSFPDIKFLSSQMARTKFKKSSRVKAERYSPKDTPAHSDLPSQRPRLSQRVEARCPTVAVEWSPSPAAQSTSGEKNDVEGVKPGNPKANNLSSQGTISPPALSRPRQTRASSSS